MIETYIYPDMELNYYWSDSFDPDFYVHLAQLGFISTAMYDKNNNPILLPEMQFEYAILDFENLHVSKKVHKLLKNASYDFQVNTAFVHVLEKINAYHKNSWLHKEYQAMLLQIQQQNPANFELMSFELYNENQILIAGEIGYKIGQTYTSLTGFFKREAQFNNWGKLQLVLLARYLEQNHYAFWNLGHASLQYKQDLGAQVLLRKDFLRRWQKAISV